MLRIERLAIGYGRKCLAEDLEGRLPRGTLTALFGPNGAGKSTLLRTIAGLLPAVSGKIVINKHHLAEYTPRSLARTLSIVLTRRAEIEQLTARETIETGRIPYLSMLSGLAKTDCAAIEHAINLTDTQQFASRQLSTLSDGERGRVFIAKALAQATPIILLDEPTAFLDFGSKVKTFRLLQRLAHEEGKAILLSTHDIETALPFADNLWLLAKRRLTCGTPTDLSEDGSLERFFLSDNLRFDSRNQRFIYNS